MNTVTVFGLKKWVTLSGLMIALIGFLSVGFVEEQGIYADYSDDLTGYCHAVAELNNLSSSSKRKTVEEIKYLVMCRTDGRKVSFDNTAPSRIVEGPDNRFVLVYDFWETADDAVIWLRSQKGVRYAEHDSEVSSSGKTNDGISFYSVGATQINLKDYLLLVQSYGNGSQTIAVIDSGVSTHSLLRDRMQSYGYDYVDADTDPTNDLSGHGTHVAGIIADCTADVPIWIYPVRVLNSTGIGKMSNVVSAVLEATEKKVDIINLSLESFEMSYALDEAIESAVNHGITVVVAAGNHNCDTSEVCPAHLTGEGIIVVGSVESSENGYHRATYSNYGNSVDLYAFGSNINSCSRSGGYVVQSGTSMAAAHISGVCALIRLMQDGLSPQAIERRLKSVCKGIELPVLDAMGFVPESEGFDLSSIKLCVGDTLQLPVGAIPSTSNAKIEWSSSDDNVVSINDDGILRTEAAGTAEIRASCMGFEDSYISVIVLDETSNCLYIPSCVNVITDEVLMGTGCHRIILPMDIESIGSRAFADCEKLQIIVLPDSVTEIGDNILDKSMHAVIICHANSIGLTYAQDQKYQYIIAAD